MLLLVLLGILGVTLGSFCAGIGCLIGTIACFVKGIMILGELTGAGLNYSCDRIWFSGFIIWLFLGWKDISKTSAIFV